MTTQILALFSYFCTYGNDVQIVNLNDENDRDEVQTVGIKINGIISVTVNMSTRNCVFYATKESVRKTLAQSLRINGFQVQTEDEKDCDDVASVHSGVSSMTDQNKAQLSSLMHDKNIPFTKAKSLGSNSIIKERYSNHEKENSIVQLNVGGPTYIDPHSFASKYVHNVVMKCM